MVFILGVATTLRKRTLASTSKIVAIVFGRIQLTAESQGETIILIPFDERITNQGIEKYINLLTNKGELHKWA